MNHHAVTRGDSRSAQFLRGGIRTRLLLLIALTLLPVLVLLEVILFQTYASRRAQVLQTEAEVAQGVATTFSAYVDGIRRQNYAVGQAIRTLAPYNKARATELLTVAAAQSPTIRNLSWVSTEGRVIASSLPALVGRDLSIRQYYRRIIAGEPWALGDLTASGIAVRSPTVGFATAIPDERGLLRGIVVAGIEPMRLGELTLTQQRPAGGAYAIFDRQGVLVYSHPVLPLTWGERVRWRESDPVLRRALATGRVQVGLVGLEVPGGRWVSARVPIAGTGWIAGAGSPVETAVVPVWRGLVRDAVIALLVFALAFVLASQFARTIARPLYRLERDAEAMGAGEIEAHSDPQAPTEVNHLRQTVTRMATDLVHRADELREANRRKDQFLAMLSHELRNPLAAIAAAVSVIRRSGCDEPMAQRAVEAAGRQVQHMKRLIDDLLDVARITRGRIELRLEPLDLRRVVESAVQTAGPSIEARAHALTVSLPPGPINLQADPVRLAQVIANLLDNAAKYTPPGGRIRLSAAREGGEAVVRVRDTGMGMPPELVSHVFDLFAQGERSLARTEGGLGIGLTMVRSLVEMHGGRVEAHSEGPGRGSEFVVRLPVPEAHVSEPTAQPVEGPTMNHGAEALNAAKRVLLVEDNADAAEMLAMTLEMEGHEVAVAHDGPAAIETAGGFCPDVVLLDLGLPGMDGYETAVRLRELPGLADTPLVAVTGYGQEEDRERTAQAGFADHLVKPLDAEDLRRVLDAVPPRSRR